MKLKPFLTILCLSALLWSSDRAVAALPDRAERPWKARWISSGTTPEQPNTWLNYRYTADLPGPGPPRSSPASERTASTGFG